MKRIESYYPATEPARTHQNIPRKIFQTMEENDVPSGMANAADTWRLKNPEYEYYFFNNNDRREFIKKHFGGRTLEAYHCIDYGPAKSDLWRYCVLYVYGGFYSDIDATCEVPLSSWVKAEDDFIVPMGRVPRTLASGFLCATPKHDFIKKAIEIATHNVLSRMKGSSIDVVGPFCSAAAVESFVGEIPDLKHGHNRVNNYSLRLLKEMKKEGDTCHCAYDANQNKILSNKYQGYLDDCKELDSNRAKRHKYASMYKEFGFGLNKLQIELTVACNLKCFNCNQQCRQAPSTDHLTLLQIKQFVKESLELDWKWQKIDIMGGEPTMHPKLLEVIAELSKLNCKIRLLTNGYGEHIQKVLATLPDFVEVKNTMKETEYQEHFTLINKAPIDYNVKGRMCRISQVCGLVLTKYGFYAAAPCAGVDRVFRYELGIRSLKDVTPEKLKEQTQILCDYCGQSPTEVFETGSQQLYSPSWQKALEEYHTVPKQMKMIYGLEVLNIL